MNKAASAIKRFFKIEERGSTIPIEILAGLVTFMTTAYVFIVHPSIMSGSGMPMGPLVVVTALIGGLSTLFMALYANMPFVLLPGMGSNALFAFTMVAAGMVTWQQGLGIVFISGIIFILLTVFGVRDLIVKMIPKSLKLAVPAAVGLFLTQLGFSNAGLMTFNNGFLSIGDIHTPQVLLALITFMIIIAMRAYNIRGALLYGMLIGTVIGIPMGLTTIPENIFGAPPAIGEIAFKLDILGALKLAYFPLIFTFFFGDFFSTMGTLLGVGGKANLLDEDGNLPEISKPFLVDAVATAVGAVLGTTTVTTYVESASGVEAGGKTGLTALTASVCFFLMILFTPIVMMIPAAVTAPVLILIGLMMLSTLKQLDYENFNEILPAFLTIVFTTFTFNIAIGLSIGILSYVFLQVITGKFKELHWGIYIVCIPLIYYFFTI